MFHYMTVVSTGRRRDPSRGCLVITFIVKSDIRRRVPAGVALTAGALVLGACASGPGNHGATAAPRSPTPQPVSVQQYRTALTNALRPLDSALRKLNTTRTYKGLTTRADAVEKAAAQAAASLGRITPPPAVAAEHPRLVSALRQFDGDAGDVSGQVGDQGLCTGPAVGTGLGRGPGTAALRDALARLSAGLPGGRPPLTLPDARATSTARPPNGHFVRSGSRGGRGTLTVDNGGSVDAVVTLVRGGKPAVSVYVRESKTYTVTGVTDGSYEIFFTGGTGWDGRARAFGRNCTFQRFDDPLRFRTVRTATEIRWSTWKITLEPVPGGNASTSDVAPGEFPAG